MLGQDGPTAPTCSRAGCLERAAWSIFWRNPRIHGTDRVKTWLSCPDHRDFFVEYLAAKNFPVRVESFEVVP